MKSSHAVSTAWGSHILPAAAEAVLRAAFAAGLLLVAPLASSGTGPAFDDSEIVSTQYPAWVSTSFLDLQQDLADARAAGKQGLMVLFDTQGCGYCRAFVERSLGDPEIAGRVRRHFDVVHLEMFDDGELTDFDGGTMPVKVFAKREGAMYSPTVAFYGPDGRRLHRAVGYQPPERFRDVLDYVVGGHYPAGSLRDYLASRADAALGAAPPAAAAGLPPRDQLDLHLRDAAQRPLLVLFEEQDCAECLGLQARELEQPATRELLERFRVTRLDGGDDATPIVLPNGQRRTPAAWATALGIDHFPALVFFDEQGTEVLRIDALVYRQRLQRSLQYVLEKAYLRDIGYQRFTREKTLERLRYDAESTP